MRAAPLGHPCPVVTKDNDNRFSHGTIGHVGEVAEASDRQELLTALTTEHFTTIFPIFSSSSPWRCQLLPHVTSMWEAGRLVCR
jgi:hypothetical protein